MFFLRADLPEADIGPERGGHHHVPPFCGTIDADGNVSHRDCEQGGNDNLYRWAFLYWFVVHRVRVPDDLHGVGVARRAGPGAQAGQKYRVEGPGGSDDALAPDRVAVPVLRHLLRRPLAMGPHHQHLRSSLLPRLSTRPSSSAGRLVGPEGRPDRERHHFSPSRDCSTFLVHVRPRYIELRSEGYDPDQDAGAGGRVLEELEEEPGPEPEALPEQRQRR